MQAEDYEAVHALYEDREALRYMDSFFRGEDHRDFFESYVKNMYRFYDFGMYVLVEKATGTIVGHVGLDVTEDETGEPAVTLGYLTARDWRRKGLALRACREILRYAKEKLGLERVQIRVHPANEPSLGLARRLSEEFPGFAVLSLAKSV